MILKYMTNGKPPGSLEPFNIFPRSIYHRCALIDNKDTKGNY